MYAGRVACCPLVSHAEYAPRALLGLEKRRDRQTDGRTDARRYITLTARRGLRNKPYAITVVFIVQDFIAEFNCYRLK